VRAQFLRPSFLGLSLVGRIPGGWGATSQARPPYPAQCGQKLAAVLGGGGPLQAWQPRQRWRARRCLACTTAQWSRG
jgi:hypothetical protein